MEPAVLSVPTVSLPEIEHPAVIEEPVVPEEPVAVEELEPITVEEPEPVAVERGRADPSWKRSSLRRGQRARADRRVRARAVVEEPEPVVVVHEPEPEPEAVSDCARADRSRRSAHPLRADHARGRAARASPRRRPPRSRLRTTRSWCAPSRPSRPSTSSWATRTRGTTPPNQPPVARVARSWGRVAALPRLDGTWQRSALPITRFALRSSAPGRRASTRQDTC